MNHPKQQLKENAKKWWLVPSSVKPTRQLCAKAMWKIAGKSRPIGKLHDFLHYCSCYTTCYLSSFWFNTSFAAIRFGFLVMLRKTNDYHDMEHSSAEKKSNHNPLINWHSGQFSGATAPLLKIEFNAPFFKGDQCAICMSSRHYIWSHSMLCSLVISAIMARRQMGKKWRIGCCWGDKLHGSGGGAAVADTD